MPLGDVAPHLPSVRLPTSCSSGYSLTYFQGPQVLPIHRITTKTHVVAVLGIEDARHRKDGWMWADFCFLNQILRGLGKTQAWFTSVDGAKLLKRQGPTVFGNPHRTRKVVYSKEIAPENVLRKSKYQLKEAFLSHLRLVADEIELGDHLLVILIGSKFWHLCRPWRAVGEHCRRAVCYQQLLVHHRCCAL